MKQKRAKSYRKQMHTLQTTFKFKTPIQCVVDSESILHAEQTKFDLVKGVKRTIQVEPKFFITQCCINHLYESKNQPAIEIAKTMEKRRCGHKGTLSSHDCIKSITCVNGENKFRYLIVTQDENLRKSLRKVPGVPLIYMNRSVMIMEPFSFATLRVVKMVEAGKLTGGLNNPNAGKHLRDEKDEESVDDADKKDEQPKKKRKGPKGPNPLSIKKKKATTPDQKQQKKKEDDGKDTDGKKKRKRSHKKKTADISEAQAADNTETSTEKKVEKDTTVTETTSEKPEKETGSKTETATEDQT
ncbi:unnamed protein product [Ambrosiozyma monospora]|uniref:U three protein 23 n=1 Tax=Ambrosiozyma monospora TaxID=43982 RepID=A0A9W7DJH3_AMBMO|nr:unnamed protein product [Ambrosiozyma monospora]